MHQDLTPDDNSLRDVGQIDQRQVERRLQERERFLRTMISNLPGIVYRCRTDERWTSEFMSGGVELIGYAPEDFTETRRVAWDDVMHPEDRERVRAEVRALIEGSAPFNTTSFLLSYRLIAASGELKHIRDRFRFVYNGMGEAVALEGVITDVTELMLAEEERSRAEEERVSLLALEQRARREAEQEREAAEAATAEAERARARAVRANRAKDEFLQMVSHEFRTPLTTIKAAARVLLHNGVSEEERCEYLETIATECDRQIDMIINLLDISRLEEGAVDLKHERVAIAEVLCSCERIERHATQARRQEFNVEKGDGLPPVYGDAKALRRALCTIIENCVKYTPEEGRITVSAELWSPEEVAVHVTDTGRGILAEDLPHIFEKFYRGKVPNAPSTDGTPDDAAGRAETPGVGLGLYLAERLIRAHDGRIEVQSQPGRGSRFSIRLPVWNEAAHEPDRADEYGFEEDTQS